MPRRSLVRKIESGHQMISSKNQRMFEDVEGAEIEAAATSATMTTETTARDCQSSTCRSLDCDRDVGGISTLQIQSSTQFSSNNDGGHPSSHRHNAFTGKKIAAAVEVIGGY